jgi:hypothetical protein
VSGADTRNGLADPAVLAGAAAELNAAGGLLHVDELLG